jgi:transcriptional regulator with XRE-family HTH domain
MKEPTQTEIAAELGLSKAALSKLKKAGMPVHSADAARAWRAAHLHQGRVRDDPGPSPRTLIERAKALLPLACEAQRSGRFDLVAGELKQALRAIPVTHRIAMALDLELWEALIGASTMAELREGSARHEAEIAALGNAVRPQDQAEPSNGEAIMTDTEYADTMYSLACGELRLMPALIRR